jgi:hypothetical protein
MTLSGKWGGAGRGNPIIAEIGTHTQFRRAGNGVRPIFFPFSSRPCRHCGSALPPGLQNRHPWRIMDATNAACGNDLTQGGITMAVELRALRPSFAAEVDGIDLSQPMDAGSVRMVFSHAGPGLSLPRGPSTKAPRSPTSRGSIRRSERAALAFARASPPTNRGKPSTVSHSSLPSPNN